MRRRSPASALAVLLGPLAACSGAPDTADLPSPATVTWSADIRGLVEAQCTTCHFTGGSAPFAFETYAQVAAAAPAMRAAMMAGRMPPWPADPSCRGYLDERILDPADVARFEAWVDQGAPEGAPSEPIAVTPAPFEADLTLRAATPYVPDLSRAGDDYRCFLLDATFEAPAWVTGNTVVPDTDAVHHVLVYALTGSQIEAAEQRDASEAGEGYTCFGGPLPSGGAGMGASAAFPTQVAGWVPGAEPIQLPEGLGVPLVPGARIVMQVHYSAVGGAPRPDHTALLLRLTRTPPAQIVRTFPLAITDLNIPGGQPDVEVSATFTNHSGAPARLTSFTGHMHLLGTSIRADVMSSSGEPSCGLSIPEWDFDWQLTYRLDPSDPLVVAPGEGIRVSCRYDNSTGNQPFVDGAQQTPRDVRWGDGSLDEMCLVYGTVVEDYTPPPPPGAGACAAAAECYADSDGSLGGLLGCASATPTCALCGVEALQSCGLLRCLLPLANARACITECVVAVNAFGGSMDSCLRAECGAPYTAMLACADPEVQAGRCDQALAGCGLTR